MAFKDERLLDRVAYGFVAGPTFTTTRVKLISGWERRNAERSIPLHRYVAPYQNIRLEHHAIVIATYIACLGPVHSFRFKDYSDYQLNAVTIGIAVGGAGETMQLIKPYAFDDIIRPRNITKPVDSTVYPTAVPLTLTQDTGGGPTPLSFTVNYLTGIVTFTSTAGAIIRATGEFDVPVFFDDDRLEFDYANYQVQSSEIVLVEDLSV